MVAGETGTVKFDVGGVVTMDEARIECLNTQGKSVCADSTKVLNKGIWTGGIRNSGPFEIQFTIDGTAAPGVVTVKVWIKGDQRWAAQDRKEAQEGLGQVSSRRGTGENVAPWADRRKDLADGGLSGHIMGSVECIASKEYVGETDMESERGRKNGCEVQAKRQMYTRPG